MSGPVRDTPHAPPRGRDAVLHRLVTGIPFIGFLGIRFERQGDELTGLLPYQDKLIGNVAIPALHGGATASFMETVAIVELAWSTLWEDMDSGRIGLPDPAAPLPPLPRTIDFTVDYLRSGLPRDSFARARVNRSGRRFASVHVEGWQDTRSRPFIQATAHFLMPQG